MTAPVAFADAGALLRQRRETLGLSQEQAAAQLNLKAVVIQQLESGQWDPQVAPTFIRGYLRHYVRLLKLNEAELLTQFDQQLATLPQASTMHSFSNKASRDAAESRFMLATYFLLVLLIGLFLVWFWQTHMLNEQPVAMLPESDSAVVSSQPAQSAVVIKPSDPTMSSPAADTAATTEMAEPPVSAPALSSAQPSTTGTEGTLATSDTPAVVATDINQPLPETQSVATKPVTAVESAIAPTVAAGDLTNTSAGITDIAATGNPPNTAGTQPETAVAGMLTLQLQFSAQCWVAVTDGSGKRLAYSMQKAGQSLTLTGAAPLQVTFGDPSAVSASLSGKTIDLSGYKQGQVARLTLTGSE